MKERITLGVLALTLLMPWAPMPGGSVAAMEQAAANAPRAASWVATMVTEMPEAPSSRESMAMYYDATGKLRTDSFHGDELVGTVIGSTSGPGIGIDHKSKTFTRSPTARQRTDKKGEAILSWHLQADLQHRHVKLVGSDWMVDGGGDGARQERTSVVRVRRRTPVEGRVVMPERGHCENLLVTGYGFGPERGDIPYARVRKDGTFSMNVASSYGYVLGILDRDWVSELWSGVILGSDTDKPHLVKLEAYRATPLTIKVSRGASREPVRDAWIEVSRKGSVEFVDGSGNPKRGTTGVREWLRTDAEGIVRTGVGRGGIEVRLSCGSWEEVKQVAAKLDELIELSFHRNWLGNRHVTARMTLDGATYQPSSDLDAFAWTEREISASNLWVLLHRARLSLTVCMK